MLLSTTSDSAWWFAVLHSCRLRRNLKLVGHSGLPWEYLVSAQSTLFSQQMFKCNGNSFRVSDWILLSVSGERVLQGAQVKGIFRMGGIWPKVKVGTEFTLSSMFMEGKWNSFVHSDIYKAIHNQDGGLEISGSISCPSSQSIWLNQSPNCGISWVIAGPFHWY